MKIGELAERTGLTPATIRFYESKGLITAVSRKSNGYREYPLEAVAVLTIISNAQKTGFSLDEIRRVLPGDLRNWQHEELVAMVEKKLEDIAAMEAKLAHSKMLLHALKALIDARPDDISCDDNAMRIMRSMGIYPEPKT